MVGAKARSSGAILSLPGWTQQTGGNAPADEKPQQHEGTTARHDVASGAGNIGIGAAKGAGDAAKGVGKGTVDLVTLHPVNAAGSVGRGAVSAGKDVTEGAAKGTGKIGRGIGKAFKRIL